MQNISTVLLSPALVVMAGAVFVHISFQLSVSVLTLLSSHTIGRRFASTKVLGLSIWYIVGVFAVTALLTLGSIVTIDGIESSYPNLVNGLPLMIAPLIALFVAAVYYRRGRGTKLWLPRPVASYVTNRAKKATSGVEAFGLGATTAFAELPFTIAPLVLVGFMLHNLPSETWAGTAHFYALIIVTPLLFVAFYLSSGHKVSSVQKWREEAKNYLRWTSAIALVLLTFYVAVLVTGEPL